MFLMATYAPTISFIERDNKEILCCIVCDSGWTRMLSSENPSPPALHSPYPPHTPRTLPPVVRCMVRLTHSSLEQLLGLSMR